MSITVKIPPILYQYTNNQRSIGVSGNTVGDCLDQLIKVFPDAKPWLVDKSGKLHIYIDIHINEKSFYPEIVSKPVKNGDELQIVYLMGGG